MTYWTASGSSSSPRGEGRIWRQASKIGGPKRQQFMLSHSGRGSVASVVGLGFSRIRVSRPAASIWPTANCRIRSAEMLLPSNIASCSNTPPPNRLARGVGGGPPPGSRCLS